MTIAVEVSMEARRLGAALGVAGVSLADEDAESIQSRIDKVGLSCAIAELNETYDVLLQAGPYIIRSQSEFGFWSNDFGFVYDRDSATGYPEADTKDPAQLLRIQVLAPDAVFVPYAGAADFDADEAPELEAFEQRH